MDQFIFRLNLIKKLRGKNNLDIAEILGVSHGTARNYMAGKTAIPMDLIGQLCKVLDISIEWLITGAGEPTQSDTVASVAMEQSAVYGSVKPGRKRAAELTSESYNLIFDEIDAISSRLIILERELRRVSGSN